MANPEHVEIVKKGAYALDLWWECNDELGPGEISLDLSGADLQGIYLENVSLKQANLSGANLNGAFLLCADFNSALLIKTKLKHAICPAGNSFDGAQMDEVDLEHAICYGAFFRSAKLRKANLKDAILTGSIFHNADLTGADLSGANICNACFSDATLNYALLDGVILYLSDTEGWKIENVKCSHFFTWPLETVNRRHPLLLRIPAHRDLAPGEFEKFSRFWLAGGRIATNDEWITITGAAEFLGCSKGTVSRMADKGEIQCNGKKGRERRVLMSSVLLKKAKREDEDRRKDTDDVLKDIAKKIPDMH